MLLKFTYFCRYRDEDKLIEKRRRKARRSKGDEGEEDTQNFLAFLEYLAEVISYIYRWNNTARMDKDALLAVKDAVMRILEMDYRLTKVTEFWNGHQVGTSRRTEMGTTRNVNSKALLVLN
jgi:hypothetical protein